MIKYIVCISLFFTCFILSAQTEDTLISYEYDTIIVVKEPVVVEQTYYLPKEKKTKNATYAFAVFASSGVVVNYMNTCDCYSKKDWENAHKGEYYFSFSSSVSKNFKKKFGLELGLSADYIKQKYSDTLNNSTFSYSNQTLYAGFISHLKYTITPTANKYGLAVYAGLKEMVVINQSGYIYNIAQHPVTNTIQEKTNSYAFGFSGRIEGNIQTGEYSRILLGINYYYDLIPYTVKSFEYNLQRNTIGLLAGYQVEF